MPKTRSTEERVKNEQKENEILTNYLSLED
jgi:hypothetical protein